MPVTYDFAVVGGGIVGLSTAMALTQRHPGAKILVIEKEAHWAQHQTGHNSGVIHSGIYYKPGSLKARFATEGAKRIPEFCQQYGLPYEVCGKVIVATSPDEIPRLDKLMERGKANGVPCERITPQQIKEIEPHGAGIDAIRVTSTGICDYKAVARKYASIVQEADGTLKLGTCVIGFVDEGVTTRIRTDHGEFVAKFVITCGGLHSDRLARMGGADPKAKIVPFRGEYYELVPERRHLCKHLIYPVPDPAFPFLGVHFTRMIDGTIHCGPNAVLAFAREGYTKSTFRFRDFFESIFYRGFRKLAAKHWKMGWMEMRRSFSKKLFTQSLQRLIPEVREEDLVPCHAGVRAQALMDDGTLVDDFLIVPGKNSMHVCNAPSPAATASIPIGREIAAQTPEPVRRTVAVSAA